MLSNAISSLVEPGIWTVVATAIVGVILYVFRRILDARLKRFEESIGHRLEVQASAAQSISASELSIYPALSELIYKIKNGAESLLGAKSAFELRPPDLIEATSELTVNLRKTRVYLSKKTFDELHSFKHLAQNLVMRLEIVTRDYNACERSVSGDLWEQVASKVMEIAATHEKLQETLRLRMRELGGM